MRTGLRIGMMTLALAGAGAAAQTARMSDDPYIWLEGKDDPKALAWVEAENARTLPRLQNDPRYATFYQQALAIASAKDRIPMPEQRMGRITNFWRDADHPQGVWRWTTPADYASATPTWKTLLDLDALSKAEGKKWVWKGANCLPPDERRCLVALSEGGEDAITYREFDLVDGAFVKNGFVLPTSKQGADWIDRDTLIVSRDWGAGTMTTSGYPFVVKRLRRGQSLAQAEEVFRGQPGDQLGTYGSVVTDAAGNRQVLVLRRPTFFGGETLAEVDGRLVKLDMPARVFPAGLVDGQVVFSTSEAWGAVPAGAIAVAPLAEVRKGRFTPQVLFAPGPRQSVDGVTVTKGRVIASVYDNVRGRAMVFARQGGAWSQRTLPLPDNASITVASATEASDTAYLSVTGFLEPTTLWRVEAAGTGAPTQVKAMPARFDASGSVVEQSRRPRPTGRRCPISSSIRVTGSGTAPPRRS